MDYEKLKEVPRRENDLTDEQSFIHPINLDGEGHDPEPIPVYDGDTDDPTGRSPLMLDETHTWSFDVTLAQVLDIGLTMIHNYKFTYDLDGMMRARDIFRRYANKDCVNGDWMAFENTDSEAYADLMWALDWLKENFTALWT